MPPSATGSTSNDASTSSKSWWGKDIIDKDIFVEVERDLGPEFMEGLIWGEEDDPDQPGYDQQAQKTFTEIEAALQKKDLDTISKKGHFLKGSSSAIGLKRVAESCEKLHKLGKANVDKGEKEKEDALKQGIEVFETLKVEHDRALTLLDTWRSKAVHGQE